MKLKYAIYTPIAYCVLFLLSSLFNPVLAKWPQTVNSADGTPIAYEVLGEGATTLVFIHGWSCDSRYWRAQIEAFKKDYRLIFIDLAGHGHSGIHRQRYTMKSFGLDVQAVVQATNTTGAVLIGHSMGGAVIAEAARLIPDKVVGLIGIDTLSNIEYPMTKEELNQMRLPLEKDFQKGMEAFVTPMIGKGVDPELKQWIMADMASSPSTVALSALDEMMSQYISGEAAKVFDEISQPVVTVNADLWPINYEANRRHMKFFDALVIKGADHFLMMTQPDQFNALLHKSIDKVIEHSASKAILVK